jgi:hypothetical protein
MLNLQSEQEVKAIFELALILRSNTPYSFRILSNHLGIFSFHSFDRLKYLNQYFQPDAMISLPIFASEVFYLTYKSLVNCPDESCTNFQNSIERANQINSLENDISNITKESSEVIEFEESAQKQLGTSNNKLTSRKGLFLLQKENVKRKWF